MYEKLTKKWSALASYPLSLLTCAAIWVLSLAPIGEMELARDVQLSDKWAHFIMYGGWCLVIWAEGLRAADVKNAARWMLVAFVGPVAMSGLLELLQAYATTYRSGEWLDLAANAIGALCGNLLGAATGVLVRRLRARA